MNTTTPRKYRIGDVIFVRDDMKPYHEFGEFHYPKGTQYIPGERLTIKSFHRGTEYRFKEKPLTLNDSHIDHTRTRKEFKENKMIKGKYYKVTDTGVQRTPDGKTFTMIGKCLEEGRLDKDGLYRCQASFISVSRKRLAPKDSWCYSHGEGGTRIFEPASPREIAWLDHCLETNKFIPLLKFKELQMKELYGGNKVKKRFPAAGWCANPSKEVMRYIADRFNDKKMIRPGSKGVAWNSRSIWPIKGYSGYPEYSNTQLEELLPKKDVVMDIETEGFRSWSSKEIAQMEGRKTRDTPEQREIKLYDPYRLDTPAPDIVPLSEKLRDYQRAYDSTVSTVMGMTNSFTARDKFTQQEPIILKNKKKKRKLITC